MPDPVSQFDDDIDRKALRALRERFLALNHARLDALRDRLTHAQRVFIDALPVLLHSNHAALPGFVDFDVAAGIERYTPDRHAIAAVRTFALSFTHERFIDRKHAIAAVYVTAPTRAGDTVALTLSVCCARTLHEGVERKLAGIARFAADRAIALTPALIDPDAHTFREQRQTPHLARDAFYRSAILLAGRYPIWWLVPPDLEDRHAAYCARLKAQRFVARDETIDLGPAERVPLAECIAAGVDTLERALNAPYANLHASMLLEAYAAGAEPLARIYKRRIWDAGAAIDETGIVHEPVAEHLHAAGTAERLELARQCLLGSTIDPVRQRELTTAWGWSDAQVRCARSDRESTIGELDAQIERVNAELAHQYRFLQASRDALDESTRARLDTLGECIERLVQRPFGALTRINAALLPRRIAGTVRVEFGDGQWRIVDDRRVAFAAPRLAEVMAWAHLHRLTLDNLRTADAHRRVACGRMLDMLSGRAHTSPYRAWIVNAQDVSTTLKPTHGDAIISDWDDALDFSGFHANLIAGIDVLDVVTDGVAASHHVGDTGLVDALVRIATEPTAVIHVSCVAGGHERIIEERLDALLAELRTAFADAARPVRFVFALGERYAIIERGTRGVGGRIVDSDDTLYRALAELPPQRQTLVADSRSPRLNALRVIGLLRPTDASERVLVHDQRGVVRVLVALRDGSIHRLAAPDLPALDVAHSVAAYLEAQFATQRDRSARLYLARGAAEPTPVMRANAAGGRYVTSIDATIARRGLVHALAEKFSIERDPTRSLSTV